MAKKALTAKQFASWVIPIDALTQVNEIVGADFAGRAIFEWLSGGFLRSAAEQSSRRGTLLEPAVRTGIFEIPYDYWRGVTSHGIWNTNSAEFDLRNADQFGLGHHIVNCIGIRFEPESLRKLIAGLPRKKVVEPRNFPNPIQPPRQQPQNSNSEYATPLQRGGRPRKEFWDSLWAAIAAQIWEGDLKPIKQADMEKAMLAWAAENGHELSEQAARSRARLFMAALKDKN